MHYANAVGDSQQYSSTALMPAIGHCLKVHTRSGGTCATPDHSTRHANVQSMPTWGKSSRKGSATMRATMVAVTTSVVAKPTRLSQLRRLKDWMSRVGNMSRQMIATAQWKLLMPCSPAVTVRLGEAGPHCSAQCSGYLQQTDHQVS